MYRTLIILSLVFSNLHSHAQFGITYDSKVYEAIRENGLSVVLWSNNPDNVNRIKKAFKDYYDFSDLTFINFKDFNAENANRKQYYLYPMMNASSNDINILKGAAFKRIYLSDNLIDIRDIKFYMTFALEYENYQELGLDVSLTELFICRLNFSLHKAEELSQSLFHKKFKESVIKPEKLSNVQFIIPEVSYAFFDKATWQKFNFNYSVVGIEELKNYIENPRSNTRILYFLGSGRFRLLEIFDPESKEIIYLHKRNVDEKNVSDEFFEQFYSEISNN